MRRALTTVLAVALLLGLGALAVLALPDANTSLAGAPAVSAAAPEFNPDAPAATNNYNAIGMPLNAASQFTSAGFSFDSDGLRQPCWRLRLPGACDGITADRSLIPGTQPAITV